MKKCLISGLVLSLMLLTACGGRHEEYVEVEPISIVIDYTREAPTKVEEEDVVFTISPFKRSEFLIEKIYNEGTEYEDIEKLYNIPVGRYSVINKGEYAGQIGLCTLDTYYNSEGIEEPIDYKDYQFLPSMGITFITVEDGYVVEIDCNSELEFKLIRTKSEEEVTTVEDADWGTPGEEYYYEYYEEPPVIDYGYDTYTPGDLMYLGEVYWGSWRFTWYSENVLPGGGLDIPGRWSDGDFVRDGYGYICCASEDLPYGSVVDTPWGAACVYDCGCASGTIDIYTSW